jgi:hypothetical protein
MSFSIWSNPTMERDLFLTETNQSRYFVEYFIEEVVFISDVCEDFILLLCEPGHKDFATENIDRHFFCSRYAADQAMELTKETDTVSREFSQIFIACVPKIGEDEEFFHKIKDERGFISSFLSMLGSRLNAFHASLSQNESFKGSKGTLFLGELYILVRNLIQSNEDLLSASETDAKDQVELQKRREPPVAMFPGSGEGRDWHPNDKFFYCLFLRNI